METHESDRITDSAGRRCRRWLPVAVLCGAALISLSCHQSAADRVATVEESTRTLAARLGYELVRRSAPLTDALQQLAEAERARRRGEAGMDPSAIGARSLERFSGLFAVAIVDREQGLRWAQARSPSSPSSADVQAIEQACDAVLRRPVPNSPTVVNRHDLQAGGSGFLIAVPVRDDGRVISFVVGVFHHDDFFSATLDEVVSADYQYRVLEGTRELFRRGGPAPWRDAYSARAAIPFFNVRWEAEISPLVVSRSAEPLAAVGSAERYPGKP